MRNSAFTFFICLLASLNMYAQTNIYLNGNVYYLKGNDRVPIGKNATVLFDDFFKSYTIYYLNINGLPEKLVFQQIRKDIYVCNQQEFLCFMPELGLSTNYSNIGYGSLLFQANTRLHQDIWSYQIINLSSNTEHSTNTRNEYITNEEQSCWQKKGDPSIPDLSNKGWLSKYQDGGVFKLSGGWEAKQEGDTYQMKGPNQKEWITISPDKVDAFREKYKQYLPEDTPWSIDKVMKNAPASTPKPKVVKTPRVGPVNPAMADMTILVLIGVVLMVFGFVVVFYGRKQLLKITSKMGITQIANSSANIDQLKRVGKSSQDDNDKIEKKSTAQKTLEMIRNESIARIWVEIIQNESIDLKKHFQLMYNNSYSLEHDKNRALENVRQGILHVNDHISKNRLQFHRFWGSTNHLQLSKLAHDVKEDNTGWLKTAEFLKNAENYTGSTKKPTKTEKSQTFDYKKNLINPQEKKESDFQGILWFIAGIIVLPIVGSFLMDLVNWLTKVIVVCVWIGLLISLIYGLTSKK